MRQRGISFDVLDIESVLRVAAEHSVTIKIELGYEQYSEVIEVYLGPSPVDLVSLIMWRSAATGQVVVDYPHIPNFSYHVTALEALISTLRKPWNELP